MPDFDQSAKDVEPPTVVDHVLLPVADLDEGARRLRDQFGLESIAGGRHPNVGTANRIVPLGSQYLELIATVDPEEAAASLLGQRMGRALKDGKKFVAWALRTQDLEAVRGKVQAAAGDLPPMIEGSRHRPDGQVLSWRTQDADSSPVPIAIPFVIEWRIPNGLYPGQAPAMHRGGVTTLRRVVVGARDPARVREQLQLLLGNSDLYEVREAGADGVQKVVLEDEDGEIVIT
jgi:Glyoxalase-like domain